jgi:MFS family permease
VSTGTEQSDPPAIRPWASFLVRDFRLVWIAILCANSSMHMRQVASLYQVYALSGSSLQLGLTGFFQALPFVCFGLLGGLLADTYDRKRMIMATQLLNLLPGLALALLTYTGNARVWHVNVLVLLTSTLQVLGGPARQAIVPGLVPPSHLMNAITLTTMMQQSTQLVGPMLAGDMIERAGLAASYLFDAALILPSIVCVGLMAASGRPEGGRRQVALGALLEGFEFIWRQRIILSLFLLDFFAVLVGYYRPLLPLFAEEVFRVGASGLGALYSAPAIGALVGSALVLLAGDIRRKGAIAVIATLFFALSLGLLGISRRFWMGLLAVGALGMTDAISVAIRRTVVQRLAPDELRGRASSFLTVFATATNALGSIVLGAAAALLGAPSALLVGSVLCIALVLGVCAAIPQLWSYRAG